MFSLLNDLMKSRAWFLGESGRKEHIARLQDHIRSIEQGQITVGENSSSCCVGQGCSKIGFWAVKEKSPYVRDYLEKLFTSKHSFMVSNLERINLSIERVRHGIKLDGVGPVDN